MVAFGLNGGWGFIAALGGFALFWEAISPFSQKFWISTLWFTAVQLVQLAWLSTTDYMGPLILVVYALVAFAIGVQFGLLTHFFVRQKFSWLTSLSCAGCWVLLEWLRHFPFTGFTWNPIGLFFANSPYALQFSSLFGIYGLSFWVILINLLLFHRKKLFPVFAALPFIYGFIQQTWVTSLSPSLTPPLSVALVQTALLPEEKDYIYRYSDRYIPPLNQWERIWISLKTAPPSQLILLPEASVSLGAHTPFYPLRLLKREWVRHFGEEALAALPPLRPSERTKFAVKTKNGWKVSNAYIAQALSNHFNAHLIAGFDDQEGGRKFNAAFHFAPHASHSERYEKRILVPVGEYLPFGEIGWVAKFLEEQFDVSGSFDVGEEAKVFSAPLPLGISICLEETYGALLRDLRLKGASLFVNLTNDVWFPRSTLPQHHFLHGKVRAAENGVFVFRACNTGVTGVIDCFGREVALLPPSEKKIDVLSLTCSPKSFATLYTFWGDGPILALSLMVLALSAKKRLLLNRGMG